ncbi:hypothetical protein TRFO_41803 [Tritrichomonas foetus]|uniref:Uncharacterized protein n=1 Tax=Tritrichomonas foetus TaxID=1144522 RepID=A0A1J4KZ19_9EUKA|nr:hypothetical protein TRFO_41803 [Tritrichomonas foetus]|eukprot:OHT16495.1 hypothetical protein TRFO_41803 [Tritrichomonas foetus]
MDNIPSPKVIIQEKKEKKSKNLIQLSPIRSPVKLMYTRDYTSLKSLNEDNDSIYDAFTNDDILNGDFDVDEAEKFIKSLNTDINSITVKSPKKTKFTAISPIDLEDFKKEAEKLNKISEQIKDNSIQEIPKTL